MYTFQYQKSRLPTASDGNPTMPIVLRSGGNCYLCIDETIHLRFQNGKIKYLNIDADRDTARHFAKHLFEPVRVFGTGRWLREEGGAWALKHFKVDRFEVLKTSELRVVVDELRAVEGSEWADQESPLNLSS